MKPTSKELAQLEQDFEKVLIKKAVEANNYFLRLEYFTNILFDSIVEDGIKIIVPVQMPEKFRKLHTEKDLTFRGTTLQADAEKIKSLYPDYTINLLQAGIERHIYPDFSVEHTEFDISESLFDHETIAFVCIPKTTNKHIENLHDYIKYILEDYCHGANNWHISLVSDCEENEIVEEIEEYDLISDPYPNFNKFYPEDEEWFEMCKTKYGISQQAINKLKNIIQSHKQFDGNEYEIR